ncbi:MAG: glycine cleavage system protein H [Planctomycetota bacterium]|jgi:glycine cleavage system H protein
MKKVKLKYSPEHNWIEFKRKVVTIGVTDFLLDEVGDLIDLCLPKSGEEVIFGISYGELESMNILRDLIAPLNGEIIKVNSDLPASLKVLQKDPFGEGWLVKVRVEETEYIDSLMEEDEYEEYKKSIKKKAGETGKKKKKVEIKKEADQKKKTVQKKTVKKKVVKKTVVKKTAVKKTAVKKTAVKKAAVKKKTVSKRKKR